MEQKRALENCNLIAWAGQSTYLDCQSLIKHVVEDMRAAMAALPFESPKFSAMAVIERADFATVLERAIERSGKANAIKQLAPPEPE